MKRFIFTIAVLGVLGLSRLGLGAIYQVTPNGSDNCGGGSCNLQAALDAAALSGEDDVLQLAAGDYSAVLGTFTYAPLFDAGSLTLAGDPAGGSVLDGGGNSVMSVDTTGSLTDANSDLVVRNITFQNGVSSNFGAGLSVQVMDANTAVEGCRFTSNSSQISASGQGGGGLVVNVTGKGGIEVANSEFRKNIAGSAGGGAALIAQGNGDIVLSGNTFAENSALDTAFGNSGGVFALSLLGNILFDRNYFFQNKSGIAGGAFIAEVFLGTGTYTNNVIAENAVFTDGSQLTSSVGGGGLVIAVGGTLNVVNNTVTGNQIDGGDAGGLAIAAADSSSTANIYNNIVFGNRAEGGIYCPLGCNDLMIFDNGGTFNLTSGIGAVINLFHNDYGQIAYQCDANAGCTPRRNTDPSTDLHVDPLFVSSGSGDFRLSSASPVIDRGDSQAPSLPLLDFDGAARVKGAAPDMGAFEFDSGASGGSEDCDNNVDDDGDQKIDCLDPDCGAAAACGGGGPGGGTENCANGADDDGDGRVDCDDSSCAGAAACQGSNAPGSENCANNVDDDGDGNIDCNDPDCAGACDGDSGNSGDVTVQSGCALSASAPVPAWSYLFLTTGLLTWLRRRKS